MDIEEGKDRAIPPGGGMAEENGISGGRGTNNSAGASSINATEQADKDSQMSEEDHNAGKKSKKEEEVNYVPYHKLFSFADSTDILLMVAGTIGALANGLATPLMTVLFGNLTNEFGRTPNVDEMVRKVSKVALQFVYVAIGAGVAAFFQVSCWMVTGERQATRIRTLYLKAILKQEVAFFDKETNTGEIIGRMSGDTVVIQEAIGEKVGKFIQLVSGFFGGFTVAFIKGWLLTLVMLCTVPPMVIVGASAAILMTKMASRGQTAYAEASTIVDQTIGGLRTVASFTGEKLAITKYSNSLKKAYTAGCQEGLASGLGLGAGMCVMFFGYALGVWYGSKLIVERGYDGGKVLNVIFAIISSSFALGETSPCISAFAAGRAAGFKMFETINRKPEIDSSEAGKKLDDIRGDIELRNVHFSYPARPDEQIFSGFSLTIPSGMTMALVGGSGSGKSTVISLIERFYDPQSGEVLIDGINIKEFQLRWLRGKIGLVGQEPVLFASSIRDNIAYGKEDATVEEIRLALELANASKFIDKMPQGVDTMVGANGTQLSGGQKQRIAIARAILKDPRILLLDEATSALDAESERIVQDALDRIMKSRTTVIVAHRLTTVRNADQIAVIHRGSIVEKGSHSKLLEDPDGAYSQLIRLQEAKKDTEQQTQPDQSISMSMDVVHRQLSRHAGSVRRTMSRTGSIHQSISRAGSLRQALSRGGSSRGSSSRRSFSVPFGLPAGIEIPEISHMEEDDEEPTHRRKEVPLRRLAILNKPEIHILLLGTIAAVVNGVILPIYGLLLSKVTQTFYEPPAVLKKDSKLWALLFFIFGFVTLLATPARSYFFAVAGSRLIRRVRLMSFEKVVHMEVGWFDEPQNSSGAIGARLSTDAATVRSLLGDALALLVQNVATLAAALIIALSSNWQLSLIILALLPMIGINGWVQMKFLKGFSADAKMMYEEASEVANESVGNIRTIASFSAEDKVMELYQKKCEGPRKTGMKQGIVSGAGFGVSFFLVFCTYATIFYAGAKLVQDGKTTFTKVYRVFFALTMAGIAISQSSGLAPDSTKAKSATASVFAILDRESKIDPSNESGTTLERVKGNIEFQHVSFKYPSRPHVQIFRDLCFTVPSGKTIALVGESGSGKSTAIALLQRFYDPDSGHVLIDGIEIQKFQVRWLRQQMGLVGQEPVLFNETIRANIAYGKREATDAEIIAAAQSANAHKFISGLHQGYDTMVGERGTQLSGGQKQRIAIARAIVKEPKILLLDEATSALDAESERVVQDALDRVMVNRTTVIVAHRLSTIRGADIIAVVKNGVIVEKGRHETLMKINDGAYASLVALHSSVS